MKRFDILIAGAGPAGLMLASELSKDFNVLVAEKEKAGTTTRAWYTFQDRIKKNKLDDAIVAKPDNLVFYIDENSNIKYNDRHALVDENKVLKIFKERAEANNCRILSNTEVKDFSYKDGGIILKTSRGNYQGNLLIDCTGTKSPIVLKKKLQKNFNIWTVYGARIKANFKNPNTIIFRKMPEKYQPKGDISNYFFGIYPKGKNEGDVYLFHYDNHVAEPEILKNLFEKSMKELFSDYKIRGVLRGNIYNGELKKYALDKVLFVGDSGALTPPAIGMGFNEILRKHKLIAERIRHQLRNNDIGEHALSDILLDYRSSTAYSFLKIVQKLYIYGDKDREKGWKDGISILNKLGKQFTRKWMRNELNPSLIKKGLKNAIEIIGVKKLIKMMPAKDYISFAKDCVTILGKSAFEQVHLAFHKQHGDKLCKMCNARRDK